MTKVLGSLFAKVSSSMAELINLNFADRQVIKLPRTPSLFWHVTQHTLVSNYQPTPHNISDELRSQHHRTASLKSRKIAAAGDTYR